MLPVLRMLFMVPLAIFTINLTVARAQILSEADFQATRAMLAAAQGGDWNRAYAEPVPLSDPLPLKILRWMDYSRPGAPGRFPDIAEFIEKNADWPRQKSLRKHAEEALAAESDTMAADWFKRFPPVSAVGKVRSAEILLNSGDLEHGVAALRTVWIDGDFGLLDERNFLARHSASIRPEDNEKRLDRLLWDAQYDAARRMLPLVRLIGASWAKRGWRWLHWQQTHGSLLLASLPGCAPIRGSFTRSCVGAPEKTWSVPQ